MALGHKTGGRTKGTLNEKTRLVPALIDQLKAENFDVVQELLKTYHQIEDPVNRSIILMKLMDFIYPKRRSIEITERPTKEVLAEWVREYLNEQSIEPPLPMLPGAVSGS